MLPYTLSALGDVDKTFALVRRHTSPDEFQTMIGAGTSFGDSLLAHPQLLVTQLPLYEDKLGYVVALRLLSPFLDPVNAMTAISLVSAIGITTILFNLSRPLAGVATLSWLALVKLFFLTSSAVTPDLVVTFIALLGFWALLSRRCWLAASLLVLGTIVRPDNVILGCTVGVVMLFQSRRAGITAIAGSILAFAADGLLSHHFGWWGQFYYNFVSTTLDLGNFHPAFSLQQYFAVLLRQTAALLHANWPYAGLGIAILAALLTSRSEDRLASHLLWALVGTMALRFVAYPSTELRHYWPVMFGFAQIALHAAAHWLADPKPMKPLSAY
ncbi:MAG TPA: hypothetical protein VMI56_02125 [Reyranella sp.]|nr:hypothetical protein [Reyranella sp.]